jgi:molybdopterin-guanine dinucleotide biosynthesis protein MobB
MPNVIRIVGPPGSGKSLLITSLVEALRSRGHRIATVVRRERFEIALADVTAAEHLNAGAAITVIALSTGGRVTIERPVPLTDLGSVVASIDPSVDLVFAEGFEDAGYPAVELSPPGGPPLQSSEEDLLAVVSSAELKGAFERVGPGETGGLADLIEREVLGREPEVSLDLEVDGERVETLGFVRDMIAKPVVAMVEQLKGVGSPRSIRLGIRRRKSDRE